jgi:hypothetical protein
MAILISKEEKLEIFCSVVAGESKRDHNDMEAYAEGLNRKYHTALMVWREIHIRKEDERMFMGGKRNDD